MKKLISIVAPMYNEESLVHVYCDEVFKAIDELKDKYDFEIILVNDGSKDNTYQLILEEQNKHPDEITAVCLSRNFGLEGAVDAGIRKALGHAVVVMDSDLQDPPSLIPQMIYKWESGVDIVVGSRVKRSSDGVFKKLGARLYYMVLDSLSGKLKLEKNAANFRLLSRNALEAVLSLPENNSVFRVVVPFVGMKTAVVEYDRDKRYAGKTKYNLSSMIPYALNSITGISVEPLRKIMWLQLLPAAGVILSIVGLIVADDIWVQAWMILLFISVFTQIVLFALSIIAEYIAQIMLEVKGRPMSIIYQYNPGKNSKGRMKV